jgi:hypothetical protein
MLPKPHDGPIRGIVETQFERCTVRYFGTLIDIPGRVQGGHGSGLGRSCVLSNDWIAKRSGAAEQPHHRPEIGRGARKPAVNRPSSRTSRVPGR